MEPLHLIIDGSDNLGKTTALQLLSEHLKLPIIKMPNMQTYIKKGDVEKYSQLFSETIIQFKQYPFLMDRGFTSSLVYSKIFGRDYNFEYLYGIEEELNPLVVIFTGRHKNPMNEEVTYKSFCKDKIFNEEQKAQVDAEFCNLAGEKGYPLIEVFGKTPLTIMNEVIKKIEFIALQGSSQMKV